MIQGWVASSKILVATPHIRRHCSECSIYIHGNRYLDVSFYYNYKTFKNSTTMGSTSAANKLTSRHPLQRLPSPSPTISALIHLIGLASFSLSYKYLFDFPTFINSSYGWHFQYLTIIGLTLAFLTFVFGFLADITLSPRLFLIKNSLSLCSAPLEVLISVLYWGISAIDKKLLVPPEIYISPYADVGFHAMPAILLTIDLLFLSPPWTINALPAMGLSSTLAVAYWAWVEQCYKYNGL